MSYSSAVSRDRKTTIAQIGSIAPGTRCRMDHDFAERLLHASNHRLARTPLLADNWEYSVPIYNHKLAATHYKHKVSVLANLCL